MKRIVYITGVISLCFFVLSGAFKILQLIVAPLLLISSAVFACFFIISFAIFKYCGSD
tara:strand:+ start:22 stop:195 length:174 start_codon:yes stop_codon:yes gene_type:complete